MRQVRTDVVHPLDEPFPPGAHDTRSALTVGRLLGVAIGTAFVTGMISHLHQHPIGWLELPSRPVWGYRFTQGLHVASGIAAVPLLLAKLWVVYRRLFTWPPVRSASHGLERLLLVPLVAGTVFELVSGLLNVARWYPWPFFFPRVHYAVALIVMGSLAAHLAFKVPLLRSSRPAEPRQVDPVPDADRRALLVGSLTAVAAVSLATVGQSVTWLRGISLLAPRDPLDGPQGLAVNRTAAVAGIASRATDPAWRLRVVGARTLELSLAELAALPQVTARLPMACVEGWSADAEWTGIPLRTVLELAGVPTGVHLRAVSLEQNWLYATSPLNPAQAWDPLTLLALRLNGQPLDLDHGYPLRLIGPNRPGVQQTKWLSRIEPA